MEKVNWEPTLPFRTLQSNELDTKDHVLEWVKSVHGRSGLEG